MSETNLRIWEFRLHPQTVPVGGPTTPKHSFDVTLMFSLTCQFDSNSWLLWVRLRGPIQFTRLTSQSAGSLRSPAVRQVCPPTGALRVLPSECSIILLGKLLYHCLFLPQQLRNNFAALREPKTGQHL